MHVAFLHRAFPSQFGVAARELSRRFGWTCSILYEQMGNCPEPTPDLMSGLNLIQVPGQSSLPADSPISWMRGHEGGLDLARRFAHVFRQDPSLQPDLIIGHCGLGPPLFLPEARSCPILLYCEYYHAADRGDLTYRVDLPSTSVNAFYPRCINATTLLGLQAATRGYSATNAQRLSFPSRYHDFIDVQFDGVDIQHYRPRPRTPIQVGGHTIPTERPVITYVARGLESLRGFDLFLRLVRRLQSWRSDLLFVIVGGDWSYYGWDRLTTGHPSFARWAIERENVDPSRLLFTGQVPGDLLALLLARSDVHVHLSVPFVVSWSLFDAMASGAPIVANDADPIREIVTHNQHALLAPLFDTDALFEHVQALLTNPERASALGAVARLHIEQHYSLDVTIPALRTLFERIAQG